MIKLSFILLEISKYNSAKRKPRLPAKDEDTDPDFDEEDEYEPIGEAYHIYYSIISQPLRLSQGPYA